jgi:hypothetical protein
MSLGTLRMILTGCKARAWEFLLQLLLQLLLLLQLQLLLQLLLQHLPLPLLLRLR